MLFRCSLILLLTTLLTQHPTFAQSTYLHLIQSPTTGYYQRLAQFSNGDLLIGDKPQVDFMPDRGFYLTRVDSCGMVVWQKYYQVLNEIMTFTHLRVDEKDAIYVFGAFVTSSINADTYLMKLDEWGEEIAVVRIDGFQKEHPYSLTVAEGQVALMGLAFNQPNVDHKTFLITLDEELEAVNNFQYTPFESYGEGRLFSDGSYVYNTGNIIIKIATDGQVEWAKEVQIPAGYLTYSEPLETEDGIIFGLQNVGFLSFFKLSFDGQLIWQSEKMPALYTPTTLQLLDEEVLAIYHLATPDGNRPVLVRLTTNGEILTQEILDVDLALNTGFTYHTIDHHQNMYLFGNANMNAFNGDYGDADFLCKFNLEAPEEHCFYWESFSDLLTQDFEIALTDIPFQVDDFPFNFSTDATLLISDYDEFQFTEICAPIAQIEEITFDTSLICDESWQVELPDGFVWEDNFTEKERNLIVPGTYTASYSYCNSQTRHIYQLEKEACACDLFIPNAFSPNDDGVNDQLESFSNCRLAELNVKIYDRWGELVYENGGLDFNWDGRFNGKNVQSGVYILLAKGQQEDFLGSLHPFEIIQDLTVIY